jgi:hypothetical protein
MGKSKRKGKGEPIVPIEKARFLRTVERNGRLYGLAEAEPPGGEPPVLVLLERRAEGDYRVAAVYRKEADPEIDWYDNSSHQAYPDISDSFGPSSSLVNEMLSAGTLLPDLERHLGDDADHNELG